MKIENDPSLGSLMTFELSKKEPIHRWFWYKEGYSPHLIEQIFRTEKFDGQGLVYDPFCGVGTTLLASKDSGFESAGIDASPLAVFVSRTKTDDYSDSDIAEVEEFLKTMHGRKTESSIRWDFELFPPRAAFPRRNLSDMLSLRQMIEDVDSKAANLLLLALVSIIPVTSIVVKDGGVLKIDKRKRAVPAKAAFKRRLKSILSDLKNSKGKAGSIPDVRLGDARFLPAKDESAGIVITSPPYLNNVDYSKIYGLEISLLSLDPSQTKKVRSGSLRSFITQENDAKTIPKEVEDAGAKIPVIGTYFSDMEKSISEMHRILRPGASAHIVVSNSVIHETHVMVDEILAQIGERLGFESSIVVGAERIADVKPHKVKTRESIVVLRK
jgi:SAM-dependent methyltransferase